MFGLSAAYSTSALPNGAAFTRWPSDAIEAIIAEVVRRGFFSVTAFIATPKNNAFFSSFQT
jgi:hypothetical protein